MRLPFVSRERHDRVVQKYEALIVAHQKEQIQHAEARTLYNSVLATHSLDRARFDSLLERFCAMKLAGAEIPVPIMPPAKKEQDPAVQRINALSAGRPGLRAQMIRQLAADRANPLADEMEIMQRIEMGVASDEGVPV